MIGTLPLPDAAEMRALDEAAIDGLGIPGTVLMERAGLAAAHEVLERYPDARRATVVCGAGNNGGDGFVVARHLRSAGIEVRVGLVGPRSRMSPDARLNHDVCERLGVPIVRGADRAALRRLLRGVDVAIDALLGTGATGAPRGAIGAAVAALNAAPCPVVALDVPSGVDASDGTVAGDAVDAACTVAFHAPKVGLLVAPGRAHSGAVVVADIGIPSSLEAPTRVSLATRGLLELAPHKAAISTKYAAGAVLVIGGAAGMTGAAQLAGMAAMRSGAGLAWLAVPTVFAAAPELMVRELPAALELADHADAVVLGPGLGRSDESGELARRIGQRHRGPIIIDADALFALSGRLDLLRRRRIPAVLTPHEGELGRLLERDSAWVRANRMEAVRTAAAQSRAVVLLKGPDTLVAASGGDRVVVSTSEAHGLATAGSGDVLSGVIGALLAGGLDPLAAAVVGAVAHARAGVLASERVGPDGIIAGDVIHDLPRVFADR
jgi:NAD(P)H-hydrate epimerase